MAITKRRSSPKKKEKEKLTPVRCRCGAAGITVKTRLGKMVTCSDPVNCIGNYRTLWRSSEEVAILEWNNLIKYGGEMK